ncbi:MAG: adenylosuccinate synthase [Anaerolineales bacterium]
MPLDIVIGAQWGDEGKGRIVDLLAADADFLARYNGGDNAGHTVTIGDQTFKLHLIPSGIIHPHTAGVLGSGMVINPATLLDEMERLRQAGVTISPERLHLSYAAHLITPAHRALDAAQEAARGTAKIGTTLRGIGPAYTDKVARRGLRMEILLDDDLLAESIQAHTAYANHLLTTQYDAEPLDATLVVDAFRGYAAALRPYIRDVAAMLYGALNHGKHVLAEGAQGSLLDLDQGTYPFVTSSNPTAPGALVGLGLGIGHVERVIAVTKAFQTRVGAGPFPTEVSGQVAERLRGSGENPWDEFGTTTGRPRRVGWLDLVLLRYAMRINGATELALTKLDILSGLDEINICAAYRKDGQTFTDLPFGPGNLEGFEPQYVTLPGWQEDVRNMRHWEDLPDAACDYILHIEEQMKVPVSMVSVGPEREQVVQIV